MNKIKIGAVGGKVFYTGNPQMLRDGEYYVAMEGNVPSGLFVKKGMDLVPVCQEKEVKLEEVTILNNYHGKASVVEPGKGYDGIGKVMYKTPKIEEKDTVKITKNGVTEIKVGKNYDAMGDVTVIVSVGE